MIIHLLYSLCKKISKNIVWKDDIIEIELINRNGKYPKKIKKDYRNSTWPYDVYNHCLDRKVYRKLYT